MITFGFIFVIHIIGGYSIPKIPLPNDDGHLNIATVRIVEECFGLSDHWSELLIIPKHNSNKMLRNIYYKLETSAIIITNLGDKEIDLFSKYRKYNDYSNEEFELEKYKPIAVIIAIRNINELESVLSLLQNDIPEIWRPESFFLIILETQCNSDDCNNIFKIIWNYWILNAVILCSSNNIANSNRSEIELYTFNPYSADHSSQWEIIIQETVEVPMSSGNFNHSWYIFKQRFNDISFFGYCENLFFDKTLNLDGYVVPISVGYSNFLSDTMDSVEANLFAADSKTLRTIAEKLRFNIAEISNNTPGGYGRFEDGTYTGMLSDLYKERIHLVPNLRGLVNYPHLGMTYPHDISSMCLASQISGIRPQWTNIAAAKNIWTGSGLLLIFITVIIWIQNRSHGFVSAFLQSQRLLAGNSILNAPTAMRPRIILASILIVVVVFEGAVKGRFISVLTIARSYPNLDTLDQIEEHNFDIYGHDYLVEWLNPKLKSRLHLVQDTADCVYSQLKYVHGTCLADCRSLQFLAPNASRIYVSRIPAWSFYVTYFTALHWPIKDRYSIELHKLVEAGIFTEWKMNPSMEFGVTSWNLENSMESPYIRPAKLNDVLPSFSILFIGFSFALIVFAWEMRTSIISPYVKS